MTPGASPSRPRAFVFAGGGTGGHIYPALAIIEQIRALDPTASVQLLISSRPGDAEILAPTGIDHQPLPAMPFSTRPRGLARFLGAWVPSVRRTRACLHELKADHDPVLVAMGGFVAAPAARGGHCEGVPVVLVNLDAVPGKANELIARRARTVWTAADVEGHRDWHRVRPIVRASTLDTPSQGPSRRSFGLDPDRPTLL
ncbi:MAG: glycosyltransferase, partial [Phycisphaerales bacterium]